MFLKSKLAKQKSLSLCCQWAERELTFQADCFSSPGSLLAWGTVFAGVFSVWGGFKVLAPVMTISKVTVIPACPFTGGGLLASSRLGRAHAAPAWRLQALHTSHSWVTFRQSTHGAGTGCLLHTSKYLQAQAPDDLNALRQLTSLCSQTCSQGAGPSPVLSHPCLCLDQGCFPSSTKGSRHSTSHWSCGQALPVHAVWKPECPDVRPSCDQLVGRHKYLFKKYLLFSFS